MSITRGIFSVTVVVEDQDRALAFYRDVLGCEVRTDIEALPGARLVEVMPPDSQVPIALLTREAGLPLGVRYTTEDADRAHRELVAAGVTPHQEVLRLDGMPPMFTFPDSEGNTVILMQSEGSPTGDSASDGPGITAILACVPVRDLETASEFYEKVFGRARDEQPMPGLAQWHEGSVVFQVTEDAHRAGGGMATLQVADFDAAAAAMNERGLDVQAADGTVVARFAAIEDPDGNQLTLVQTRD